MLPGYLDHAKFWQLLVDIDHDLLTQRRAKGCAYCAGVLHRADYPRKPRGVPRDVLGEAYARRLSLCCASDGCRRRATPASVRFLARRVYLGALVVLVSALSHGLSARRRALLCEGLGLDEQTLKRWRQWWHREVPQTPWWRCFGAQFVAHPSAASLPTSLLERAGPSPSPAALVRTLRWLEPLSVCGQAR